MSNLHTSLLKIRPTFLSVALKKLLGIKRTVANTTFGDFFVDPVSNFGNSLLSNQEYEPDLMAYIQKHLKPGDSFLDLGANEGFFSIVASNIVGPTGKVYTIEPQERLQEIITENIRLNNADNVEMIKKAVSDTKGTTEMYLAPDTNTGSTSLANPHKYSVPTQTVEMDTLENILDEQNIDTIDLAKIDIEGFEYETVLGSKQLFRDQRIKRIALEIHYYELIDRKLDSDDIQNFLKDCGYSFLREHSWWYLVAQ